MVPAVYYTRQKLSQAECNYLTAEREALGMIYNVTKFRHYLLGRKFSFHVDHSELLYLVSEASLIGKLLLQKFYAVVHKRSTLYYPQANGLAESTNKTLQNILQKIVNEY